MSLDCISLTELSVVFHIRKYWRFVLYQSRATEGSWKTNFSASWCHYIFYPDCAWISRTHIPRPGDWSCLCNIPFTTAVDSTHFRHDYTCNSLWRIIIYKVEVCHNNTNVELRAALLMSYFFAAAHDLQSVAENSAKKQVGCRPQLFRCRFAGSVKFR